MTSPSGHPRVDVVSLRDVADPPPHACRVRRRVDSEDANRAGSGGEHPHEDLDRRTLTRAVRADQAERGAPGDGERQVIEDRRRAVALTDADEFDRRSVRIAWYHGRPPAR